MPPGEQARAELSSLAENTEVFLKELRAKAGKPVFLVIDDLDKLRDRTAQKDVFLERAMAWLRLPAGIVATLPLDLVFAARGRELDDLWGAVHILDPLPVPGGDYRRYRGLREDAGIGDEKQQWYWSVLKSVEADRLISPLQCRRLANISSGLPRSFVHDCAASVRYALEAGRDHVSHQHIDLVAQDHIAIWRGRFTDEDYEAVIGVLDSGGSNVPKAARWLHDGLLIRDGTDPRGEQYRLATWAEPLVQA